MSERDFGGEINYNRFSDERVIVTGSNGVLGTALKGLILRTGAPLFAPSRQDIDLTDFSQTKAAFAEFKPTLVFHLAGWVAGLEGNRQFSGEAFYQNICINSNVIEASRIAKVRKIVVAGTAAIYSDAVPLPMREVDFWKDAPHGSEASYAHAKRAALAHLESYRLQYGLPYGYMVCTNLYGPNDRFDEAYGHVVPSLISRFHRAAEERASEIVIWGDGSPTRDFLFSNDAAKAFLIVADKGVGVYNTATGKARSIRSLVESLVKISNFKGIVRWDTARPNGQLRRGYDISRLLDLGWQSSSTLEDGLEETYRWYASNYRNARR